MAKLKDGTRVYGGLTVDDALLVTDVTISGNLIIQGTTTTVDSTVTQLEDPVLELGNGANGAALTTNDGKERGLSMHYYNGAAKNAFMGWHTTNGEFVLASEVTVSDNDVTAVSAYGNVHAGHFIGEGDTLANISGANVTGTVLNANMAAYAGNVVNAAQSNITSLGTLTELYVSDVANFAGIYSNAEANVDSLVTVGDANIGGDLNVTGNITGTFTGTIAAKGSDTYVQFNDGGNVNGVAGLTFDKSANTLTATGTITGGNLSTGGTANVTGTANVGNLETSGAVTATGNVSGGNLTTGGVVSATGNVSGGNLTTGGVVSATGNVSGANLVTLGGVYGNIGTFTGNASAANISTGGLIVATGSVTGGSLETGGTANVTGTANVGNLVSPGSANITGNIDGANLNTAGVVQATGNVTGGNLVTTGTANIGNLAISGSITGDLIPATNEGGNLGNSTHAWKDLWLSGNSIKLGDQTISSNTTTVSVSSDLGANNIVITNNANVGNLNATGTIIGANVTANNLTNTHITFAGTGGLLTDDANLTFNVGTGELSATLLKGTLSTAAQPNVTSVGNLTTLTVVGQSNVADILIDGDANITGNVNVGGVVIANGEITAAAFNTDGHVTANGDFDGANATFSGTLSAGDTTINGNLTVTGTTTSVNTTVTQLTDPLFELGGGANGAALGTADGMDRGLLLHRYDGGAVDSFIGWDEANAQFVVGSNVSVTDNVVTVNEYGDWKAGNATFTGNISGENLNIGGVIIANGNITSNGYFTGNLVGDVIGNISGNIKVAGANGSLQFATNVTTHVGSAMDASTIVIGKTYTINTSGNTDFVAIGAADNNPGTVFTATGTSSGTGKVGLTSTYGDLSNDDGNLVYDITSGTLTVGGNIEVGGILTDNYYYANGDAVDFQQAAGSNTEIQFNDGAGGFGASSKFTFDTGSNTLAVTGTVTASNVTVSSLTSGTLTVAGTSGALQDATGLTYSGTTLTTGNANVTTTLTSGNVKVSALSAGKVVISGADGLLTNDAELSYDSATNTLTSNNVTATEKVSAANVAASSLTAGRVTFAGSAGLLVDNGNLTYDGPTNVLSVTGGNVSANYINGTYLTGNGSAIANITGANVDGQVGNALVASTVYGNAQANITSLGTLTGLTVSGATDLGAVGNVTITGGVDGAYLKTDGSGSLSWATVDTSTVANGTSNVSIPVADGNVLIVSGANTVLTVTGLGANVTGYVDVTGDINANNITANGTLSAIGNVDSNSSITGTMTVTGGIGATGNIYTGHSVGFANNNGGTASAAYIQFNATANSLDFIFN